MRFVQARLLLTVVLLLAAASAARGATVVRVAARVVPFFLSEVTQTPLTITITQENLEDGFVDLVGPSLVVRTNDPAGYLVALRFEKTLVERVEVEGLQAPLTASGAGGFALQRFERVGTVRTELRYRVYLRPDCKAGVYPFPVSVTLHRRTA